jgi:hypothetical protein
VAYLTEREEGESHCGVRIDIDHIEFEGIDLLKAGVVELGVSGKTSEG